MAPSSFPAFAFAVQPAPKKWEPPVPTRVGKKKKKGPDAVNKLPPVYPTMRCKLKMLKQERIKDYLILEEGMRVDSFTVDHALMYPLFRIHHQSNPSDIRDRRCRRG